ncbi:MAG TPA: polyphosphate kinase 2 family protein [Myxococcaceae bacterium]|nr:polyphosphate kinase 2 family protein [Myxococcaceae bacterium]
MDYRQQFRVQPGSSVDLAKIDPDLVPEQPSKTEADEELRQSIDALGKLQYRMWAEQKHALLVVLQGLDAAGKDGTVRHVMTGINPAGCRVTAFKEPTKEELAHDFLWRVHPHVAARGEVAVFNRSHYEEVLIVRVHQLAPAAVWSQRYDEINAFEVMLHRESQTTILKFFLHISKDEQLRRFENRLEDPMRQWKISEADYRERDHWDDYQTAYQDALSRTSTEHAPWFVIPANHKWFRNLAVAKILVETLEAMKIELPQPTVDLKRIRELFHKAGAGKEAPAPGRPVR